MTWENVRKRVLDRDGRCLRCGAQATDVHHRKPKKMGGTKNQETWFSLANLVSLCRQCHSHVHSYSNRYVDGWMVHSWDDPENIPIRLSFSKFTEFVVMLKSDGTVSFTGECEPF